MTGKTKDKVNDIMKMMMYFIKYVVSKVVRTSDEYQGKVSNALAIIAAPAITVAAYRQTDFKYI